MKKILLLLLSLSACFAMHGQHREAIKDISGVTFYGIDFSKVKVYGATETPTAFKYAFEMINKLMITESRKYNISKAITRSVTDNQVDVTIKRIESIKDEELMATTNTNPLTEADLAAAVKALPIKKGSGTGVVFIAEMLDKPAHIGTYHVVYFDISTKKIITSWRDSGKAGGTGLRNYWAGSIYKMLKGMKVS